jgi:Tol biopolymer transport system component
MRHGTWRALAIVAAFAAAGALHGQARPETALRAAIELEEVKGDIKGAIEQYRKLADTADRAVAAQALLRLAAAYQAVGDVQARSAYERIVNDFSDQRAALALARERLSRMPQPPQARAEGRVDEVVWSGRGVTMDVWPLPDGRSVAHWDLPTGNLALRELATGRTRLLTSDAAGENFYERPVVSPSGTRIAVRYGQDGAEPGSAIRLVSIDGQRNEVLLRDAHEHWLVAWSPDEQYLAAERWPGDGTVTFVLISTTDGRVRQITTPPGGGLLGGFSRDGRYIVYTRSYTESAPENATGGVYLMATDGSASVPLFESPHQFRSPTWSLDGRHVFFTSDRSGAPALWSIEVVNGKPAGEPVVRERGFNATRFLGFTRDGSLFYGHAESQSDVYLVDFNPATLRATSPTRITEHFVGRNSYPVLSPDGRHVAFVRRAGAGPSVVLRTLESKEERTLVNFLRPYGANVLHWFPDGRALLLTDRIERRKRFRKIDVRTGESTTLFEGPWDVWTGALSPDGSTLYYSAKDEKGLGNRLVKRRLDSGAEEEIYRTPPLLAEGIGLFGLSVSPSGDRLAFTRNVDEGCPGTLRTPLCRLLMVMPSSGGDPRELLRSPRLFFHGPIGWSADGRHLIIALSGVGDHDQHFETTGEDPQQLYALTVETGEMRPLGIEMPQITSRVVSDDGRRIALTEESNRNEIRVLRNILRVP